LSRRAVRLARGRGVREANRRIVAGCTLVASAFIKRIALLALMSSAVLGGCVTATFTQTSNSYVVHKADAPPRSSSIVTIDSGGAAPPCR
jgi:hypothetical protein